MSSFQDKLYNHEVIPPVNCWEKVAAALDNAKTRIDFSSRLYNIEVVPPIKAWENIAAALENAKPQNNFSSRLYNMEVDPPAKTWRKIVDTLDEKKLQNEFPSRLYNMEVNPPANVWAKVAAGLNTTGVYINSPVRRIIPIIRYAAAAIFIGAVAFGIINLTLNTGNDDNNTVGSTINKDSSTADINKEGNPGKTETLEINISKNDADAIEKSKPVSAKSARSVQRVSRAITTSMIASDDEDVADTELSQSLYAYADHIPDIADRYVMLITPDGNIIRMAKKWGSLLCCVSGEEQDTECKNQLKKWQEKIATSSLAPSPGNFMDILSLVNSLNEDNGL